MGYKIKWKYRLPMGTGDPIKVTAKQARITAEYRRNIFKKTAHEKWLTTSPIFIGL